MAEQIYDNIQKETDYWINYSKQWTGDTPEAQRIYDNIKKEQQHWIDYSR